MRKEQILFLILIGIIYSCETNLNQNSAEYIPQEKWNNLNDLNGEWIELERDKEGYFLYDPCDGETPEVIIDNKSILLKHQIEEPTIFEITEYNVTNDSISIKSKNENLKAEFTFKLVKQKQNLILFKWNYPKYKNQGKRIITRLKLAKKLRLVKDPCDIEKVPKQEFLPVEFN